MGKNEEWRRYIGSKKIKSRTNWGGDKQKIMIITGWKPCKQGQHGNKAVISQQKWLLKIQEKAMTVWENNDMWTSQIQ